ncbi:hypothetical protein SCLCIDRAFT_22402 [Scleroderma citrinum Foug A]|uniref:RRM domain-containing protein n=1 Tax=Scleroderma citrinum Foug A TaxID=1036808 RepID=A0A0C3ALM0_9AGAM|nr:hypothetical protein SCLCIDRAFT_22402 [Scleroderma citrinum Foug A]
MSPPPPQELKSLINHSLLDSIEAQGNMEPMFISSQPQITMSQSVLELDFTAFFQAEIQVISFTIPHSGLTSHIRPVKFQLQSQVHNVFLIQNQIPYVPHLQSNRSPTVRSKVMLATTGSIEPRQWEEISTIFVVGFPNDMREREFQNMFIFFPGFVAATLTILNKEGTAYGSSRHTGAMNPPLRGRDDHTMSWPPLPVRSLVADHSGRFQGISAQPRKQIIGFAKFRTHQEALEAKKVLEGHQIDAKNDTVLRVEMAKKNLHTKRSAPHW